MGLNEVDHLGCPIESNPISAQEHPSPIPTGASLLENYPVQKEKQIAVF
jgi:hypothetical protein